MTWSPRGVIPADAGDETIEALVRIYVGDLAGLEDTEVTLGEPERAVILVAQAEVACVVAAGQTPCLRFAGPPLAVEVASQ